MASATNAGARKLMRIRKTLLACTMMSVITIATSSGCNSNQHSDDTDYEGQTLLGDWRHYGGDLHNTQFSHLDLINRENVTQLKEAWRFSTEEVGDSQTTPLVIDGTLYGFTPALKVFALDAAKGSLRWQFDTGAADPLTGNVRAFAGPARGLVYWSEGNKSRLFAGVMDRLYAINPQTGMPVAEFGDGGSIDLRKGLSGDYTKSFVALSTPGLIYKDLLIVGFRTSENTPAPAGDIRAYDVLTGELRWVFHTIPRPGEPGVDTWPENALEVSGGANNWAGMALDEERGIVYVPTGSAVPDFYGGKRPGDNLYANSLLALNAATGERLWHFQTTRHDIWDRDLPSRPVLFSINLEGEQVDAVVQATKQGFLFVFDRVTGEPLFPIEERPVPTSSVPGEVTAETQPFPLLPRPFSRQHLTKDMLTTRTPAVNAWALEAFRSMRSEGQYVPFSVGQPTVMFPGFDGGAGWGGSALDPASAIIYVNANDVAWTGSLVEETVIKDIGADVYMSHCSVCHGAELKGSPPEFPRLVDITERLSVAEIKTLIYEGRGRMQSFSNLTVEEVDQLMSFLSNPALSNPAQGDTAQTSADAEAGIKQEATSVDQESKRPAYRFTGYKKFLDPDGYPAIEPPWGTLNAIDLNSGEFIWTVPLGEYPELAAQGLSDTGTENYGGPILTAGGLVFIAATIYDQKIRAYNSATGELLWQAKLPFAGTATPVTYLANGHQYLVIATNNARNRNGPQGNAYVSFRLPE